jgi:hypothetical protein
MIFQWLRPTIGMMALLAGTVSATSWAADAHCPASNTSNLEQELTQVTQEMLNGVAIGNKQLWNECLSEAALITGDDGLLLSKNKFLSELRALPQGYEGRIQLVRPQLLQREHVAILSYDLDEQETVYGQQIRQRYHTTDTWAVENGAWRLVGSQATRIYQDPAENGLSSRVSGDLVGTYELASGITYTITLEGNQLFGERSGRKKEPLFQEAIDVFLRKGVPGRRIFLRNAQGVVTGFMDRVNGADLVWLRKSTEKEPSSMKQFVFFYKQGGTQLSDTEQKRRAAEVREWALRMNQEGRKFDGRILGAEQRQIVATGGIDSNRQNDNQSLIAITFLEARDFAEAVSIAKTHPGLHYGVSIEVREWTAPPSSSVSSTPEKRP